MTPATATPKQRFQESKDNISKHRALVESREFERAIDFALAEYQLRIAKMEPSLAAAAHFKSVGAQEFIAELKNLSETTAVTKTQSPPQLTGAQ